MLAGTLVELSDLADPAGQSRLRWKSRLERSPRAIGPRAIGPRAIKPRASAAGNRATGDRASGKGASGDRASGIGPSCIGHRAIAHRASGIAHRVSGDRVGRVSNCNHALPSDLGDPAGQRGGRREPGNASHPRLCKTAPSLLRKSHVTGGAIGYINYIKGHSLYMGIEHSKISKLSDMCRNVDIKGVIGNLMNFSQT